MANWSQNLNPLASKLSKREHSTWPRSEAVLHEFYVYSYVAQLRRAPDPPVNLKRWRRSAQQWPSATLREKCNILEGGILHVLGVLFGILTIFPSAMQENDFRQSEMQREATLNDFSDMTVDSWINCVSEQPAYFSHVSISALGSTVYDATSF